MTNFVVIGSGAKVSTEIDMENISQKDFQDMIDASKEEIIKEARNRVFFLSRATRYSVIENTKNILHVKQALKVEAYGYKRENVDFSWKIEKKGGVPFADAPHFEVDITENKDTRDGAEYPSRWPTLGRAVWEYEMYMLPFMLNARQTGISQEIKLDGLREVYREYGW